MDFENLKKVKNKRDLLDFLRSCEESKYREFAIKKVLKQNFSDALQTAWNFALQQDGKYFLGKEVTRNSWYKGSAIAGMECHSK